MEATRLEAVLNILRRATILVKVMPFAFALFYLIGITSYMFLPNVAIRWIDLAFYISPAGVIYSLLLSKVFKLCRWHRRECVLPLLGIISIAINDFVIEYGAYGELANWILIIAILLFSLINAYFVFIKK
jgi:hypothetical protein